MSALRWTPNKPQSKGAGLVEAAGTKLVLDYPFFASLYLRLAVQEMPGVGTFFTDGRRIGYDPAFAETIGNVDEVLFVLAHEVMHNALCHPFRRGARDVQLWNDACDYAINAALVDMGLRMPTAKFTEGLLDARFGSMAAEEIYEVLLKEQQAQPKPQGGGADQQQPSPGGKQAQGGSKGKAGGKADKPAEKGKASGSGKPEQQAGQDDQSGSSDGADQGQPQQGQGEGGSGLPKRQRGFDVVLDATDEQGQPLSKPEAEAAAREWEIAAQAAAMQQVAQGNMPGMLKELIKPAKADADWRALLARWMQERVIGDYSWARPNPRHAGRGIYLPSQREDAMGEMVVVIDTSGSIYSELLQKFLAEIDAQRAAVKPTRLHVLVADAVVQGHWEFEQHEPIEGVEMRGRGGTDFRPAFRWCEEAGVQPACLVYLTDLAGTYPPQDPGYPVLWANYSPGTERHYKPPFGEVITIAPER